MKKGAQILSLLAATVVLFILFDIALMFWQLTPISAVSKYENVKRLRWHRKDLVKHFPETIPSVARDPRFYYHAGFLQGGASIELRMQLPAESVEEVYATYVRQAKSIFDGARKLPSDSSNPNVLPKWRFFTFPPEQDETPNVPPLLPRDFEIMLLSSYPYKSNPTEWNHGESSGISISRERSEIIYWAEDW